MWKSPFFHIFLSAKHLTAEVNVENSDECGKLAFFIFEIMASYITCYVNLGNRLVHMHLMDFPCLWMSYNVDYVNLGRTLRNEAGRGLDSGQEWC